MILQIVELPAWPLLLEFEELLAVDGGGFFSTAFTVLSVTAGVLAGVATIGAAVVTAPASVTILTVCAGVYTIEAAVSGGMAYVASKQNR